jgi:Rho GDP-dissociation inhibitor
MKVNFKVQHNVLSGLKYLQVVSRGPLKQKQQEMIVSI